MALSGDLASMPAEDLMQLIERGAKSGVLTIKNPEDSRNIFFINGDITGVNSSRSKDKLGAFLLRNTKINSEQLAKFRQEQHESSLQLGEMLIRSNLITRPELDSILDEQVVEIVFDVLCLPSGEFTFEERELRISERVTSPQKTSNLLLEAARRKDEFRRNLDMFPDEKHVYVKSSETENKSSKNELENEILEFLTAPQPLSSVKDQINATQFNIMKTMNDLMHEGAIVRDLEAEAHRQTLSMLITEHIRRAASLKEERGFHEALYQIEAAQKIDPFHLELQKLKSSIEGEIVRDARKLIESVDLVPRIRQTFASLQSDKFSFSAQEGFVFSRIDGRTSIKALKYLTNLGLNQLFIIIHKFIRMGLVYIDKSQVGSDNLRQQLRK